MAGKYKACEAIYQEESFIALRLLTNQFLRVGLPLVAFKTAWSCVIHCCFDTLMH